MRWRRHHGKTRLTQHCELTGFNIVLTTYHIVAADWKAHEMGGSSLLLSTRWKRLVLDEGTPLSLTLLGLFY